MKVDVAVLRRSFFVIKKIPTRKPLRRQYREGITSSASEVTHPVNFYAIQLERYIKINARAQGLHQSSVGTEFLL